MSDIADLLMKLSQVSIGFYLVVNAGDFFSAYKSITSDSLITPYEYEERMKQWGAVNPPVSQVFYYLGVGGRGLAYRIHEKRNQ